MNKLLEFSNSAFDVFDTVEGVVEDILGKLGRLHRNDWVIDATIDERQNSILYTLAEKFSMNIADASGVSTGVNECIERSGASKDAIACVVAYNPCAICPPVMVLKDETSVQDDYVKLYSTRESSSSYAVFVRRDLARRVGATSMEIFGKKNTTNTQ
jgi:hypothetical protein